MDIELMKAQRVKLKLSQQAVADAVGRHRSQVARWENGQQQPDLAVVPALAEIYQVSLERLLGVAEPAGEVAS